MDINMVYECIGYGATQAVASHNFSATPSRIPARYILETARDPVAYCIEAYARQRPEQASTIDQEGRAMILLHLEKEAGLVTL